MHSDPPEVCPLSGGMMLSDDAIPIHAITARPSLFPASSTRRRITRLCSSASTSVWVTTGLPSFIQVLSSGLDGPCIPVSVVSASSHKPQGETAHSAILASAYQRLWHLSDYGTSMDLHICSSYRSSLAPSPDDASSGCRPLAVRAPALRPGVHCPEGFAPGRYQPRTPR
jgi:hypothetical protein